MKTEMKRLPSHNKGILLPKVRSTGGAPGKVCRTVTDLRCSVSPRAKPLGAEMTNGELFLIFDGQFELLRQFASDITTVTAVVDERDRPMRAVCSVDDDCDCF
jgi:hypothetical protein